MTFRLAFFFAALPSLVALEPVESQYSIFKSSDRGRSWSRADSGLPRNVRINAFALIRGTLLAGTDAGIYSAQNPVSKGSAIVWSRPLGASSGRILGLATVGQKVFAAERQGLIVSGNAGANWASVSNLPTRNIRSLLSFHGILYVGCDSDGVYASADEGKNWTPMRTGLPQQAQVFAMTMHQGKLFAGLYSKGLYTWKEQAWGVGQWVKVGAVAPLVLVNSKGKLIVGHNPGGVHRSEDGGVSWTQPISAIARNAPVWEIAADDKIVLVGAAAGIYYSEDQGLTWLQAKVGLPAEAPGISFLVTDNLLLAATSMAAPKGL